MSLKVHLMDIFKRIIQFDKKVGIIRNGADNAYSERIERFINNSVTAKTSSNIMASYLAGKGFGDEENKILVSKGTSLLKFTQKAAKNISKQRGVFIHINYNANFGFDSFDILPYSHCRLGKKDDNRYNGKIGVSDKFINDKLKNEDVEFINVFNPDKKVIQSQVDAVSGWSNYRGQIWCVNLDDEYDYALSTIDAVQYDCDSEGQASLFKNRSLRKGFFGKTVVVTRPLIGKREDYNSDLEFASAENERENFKGTIDKFIGADNAGGVLHVEMEQDTDRSLDDAIKFENISSDIDDKLFKYTEESVFKNILMAFNNIPMGLVRSDNALFGNSGESLKEMKRTYQDNTSLERDELEQVVQVLMANFKEPKEVHIVPLIDEEEEVIETKPIEDDTTDNKD